MELDGVEREDYENATLNVVTINDGGINRVVVHLTENYDRYKGNLEVIDWLIAHEDKLR